MSKPSNTMKWHPSVVDLSELLLVHLVLKQILVNPLIALKNNLSNEQIVNAIGEIETNIKNAEPKVDMIFWETAGIGKS